MNRYLTIIVVLIFISPINTDPCPGIALEGSSYTFVEDVTYSSIEWFFIVIGSTVDNAALFCRFEPYHCNGVSEMYSGNITCSDARITIGISQRDSCKGTMTIRNVKRDRDATEWIWSPTPGTYGIRRTCDLEVYSSIPTPICDDIQFTNNKTKLTLTCSVSKVYPETLCQVEYKKDNDGYKTVSTSSITTRQGKLSGKPLYYDNNTCTLTLLLSNSVFTSGSTYKYRFTMYPPRTPQLRKIVESNEITIRTPELTNKANDGQIHTVSNGTDYITIYIPIVVCPTPTTLKLYKVVSGYTSTNNFTNLGYQVDKLGGDFFTASYLSYHDSNGTVTLTVKAISGQYVMRIDNGIGDGLNFTFGVVVKARAATPNERLSSGVIVGITASVCLVVGIICFIVGKKGEDLHKKRKSKMETKARVLQALSKQQSE